MNKVINKFLLAGDNFMPTLHLRQPVFTCNACGSFTINIIAGFKNSKKHDLNYIFDKELDKNFLLIVQI